MEQKPERLFLLAQRIAEQTRAFFETKEPGQGDRATNEFMDTLRRVAQATFGQDYGERTVREGVGYALDFYFPDEKTAIEVALSLHQPMTEYERDIFKCLLGQESGIPIDRVLFIAKPGASSRQSAPGPKAIADFVRRKFGLSVEVLELVPPED
jgi:hypothetical protein